MKNRIVCHTHVIDQGPGQRVGYLAGARVEGFGDYGEEAFVISSAERFQMAVGALGENATGVRAGLGFIEDAAQGGWRDARHIAGEDQAPAGGGVGKGGFDTSEGAGVGTAVGDDGEAQVSVHFGGTDNCDAAGGVADGGDGNFEQGAAIERQESLIPSHAGACAARKHIARRLHGTDDIIRGLNHLGRGSNHLGWGLDHLGHGHGLFDGNSKYTGLGEFLRLDLNGNKIERICSIILGWMLVFSTVVPLAAQNQHVTVVVHPDLQTGKLIQSVVVQAREVAARVHEPIKEAVLNVPVALSSNIIEMVDQIAVAYGVEGPLVHSVIRAESNYNAQAVSNKGALGLMQLIPSTARRFGVANPFDPRQNVEGGVRYLRFLLDYYKNDYKKAIAAYNAGEGAVDRYQGIPPYTETRNYVTQVAMNLKAARQAAESKQKAAEMAAARVAGEKVPAQQNGAAREETYNPIRASLAEDGRVYYRTQ